MSLGGDGGDYDDYDDDDEGDNDGGRQVLGCGYAIYDEDVVRLSGIRFGGFVHTRTSTYIDWIDWHQMCPFRKQSKQANKNQSGLFNLLFWFGLFSEAQGLKVPLLCILCNYVSRVMVCFELKIFNRGTHLQ